MNLTLRGFLLAAMSAPLIFAASAAAQTYPVKPVRVIVPFPPGNTADILARLIKDFQPVALLATSASNRSK